MLYTAPLATALLEAPEETGTLSVMLLAILQGLAEFLPISSSGHLVLARITLGVEEAGLALDVALHVGTLLAVVLAFREDVRRLFADLFAGRFRMWLWLIVATLPIAVIGLAFKDVIEGAAQTARAAGIGLFVTAVALFIGERARLVVARATGNSKPGNSKPVEPVGSAPESDPWGAPRFSDAVFIGLAQAFAIWPGISRSGSTIAAGLVRGVSAQQAARLSFLMSLPAVTGAAIVELPGAIEHGFGGVDPWIVVLAAALAALVGWGALRTLLLVLRKGSFPWFAGYCMVIGTLALALG